MLCSVLTTMFGRDTRPTQFINVVVSLAWSLALLLHTIGSVAIELPAPIANKHEPIMYFMVATIVFGVIGLATQGRTHQVFKSFGLILGALSQAILANGYVTEFPPLDMHIVVCSGLSVWFLLAVFYIFKCEGIDERTT